MQEPHPYRRLFGMPMWFWVVLTIPLLVVGNMLPQWWAPVSLAEPKERSLIFQTMLLVTSEKDGFRFVPFGEHEGVVPLWHFTCRVHETSNIHWETKFLIPGLFVRKSNWNYELTACRFDKEWKDSKNHPYMLSDKQVQELRPQIIEELNKQKPGERLGDRLDQLLQHGLEETSYVCLQNVIIWIVYLSIVLAVVAIGFRFLTPPALTDLPPPR